MTDKMVCTDFNQPIEKIRLLSMLILLLITQPFEGFAKGFQEGHEISQKAPHNPDLHRLAIVSDSLAPLLLEDELVPGMNIAVAKDGKILFTRSYGLADVELKVPAQPEHVFGLNSVTKQFTATAIMQLVEQGKITLEDPIIKYLNDFPTQGQPIKIKHLLNHNSGIRDRSPNSPQDLQKLRLDLSYEELVDMTTQQPFLFAPGEKHDYNNMGYTLLGEIIKRVTGKSWMDYIESYFLIPLNLKNTYFGDPIEIIPNRVSGYLHRGGKLVNAPYISMEIAGPAGALFSTVEDLIIWTHMLHNEKIISKKYIDQMTSPTELKNGDTIPYGYGLRLDELEGHKKVYHGGAFGFGPYVAHYPVDGLTIAILTNSTKGREKAEILEKTLARIALNVELKDLPLKQEEIKKYENIYTYGPESKAQEIRILGKDDYLMAQINQGKPFKLLYQGNKEFIPAVNDIMCFIFIEDNTGIIGFDIKEGPWSSIRVIIKEQKK